MEITLLPPNYISSILKRISSNPIIVFFLVLVFNIVTKIPLALYYDAWFPNDQNYGLSREVGWWVVDFIAQPIIFSYLVWIGPASKNLLETFISEKRFVSEAGLDRLIRQATDRANNPWVNRFAFIFGILIETIVVIALMFLPNKTWITAHPVILVYTSVIGVIAYYAIALLIFTFFHLLATLNNMIRNNGIRVEPFHPDNAGGLGCIGRFVSNLGYIFFASGIGLTLSYYQALQYINLSSSLTFWLYITIVATILLIIFIPTAFFVPLFTTHLGMKMYQDGIIDKISKEYDQIYSDINTIFKENSEIIKLFTAKLKELQELRERTAEFPTWPYNFGNLRKFFGLSIAPIATTILTILIDVIFK